MMPSSSILKAAENVILIPNETDTEAENAISL